MNSKNEGNAADYPNNPQQVRSQQLQAQQQQQQQQQRHTIPGLTLEDRHAVMSQL